MDVQGYDLKVLQGAKKFILENKPVLILELEEYCFERYKQSTNDVLKFLKEIDFELILIKNEKTRYLSHYIGIFKERVADISKMGELSVLEKGLELPAKHLQNKVIKVLTLKD